MMLPRRYLFLNWLIRRTGRQFYEQHSSWFTARGGHIVREVTPLGTYRLASRAEAGLPDDASDIARFWARSKFAAGQAPNPLLINLLDKIPIEKHNRKENSNA